MNRFDRFGNPIRTAVGVSRGDALSNEESDIRVLSRRITTLERNSPPAAVEYDFLYATAGSQIVINHTLGPSVRWVVVNWRPGTSVPTDGFYRVWEVSQANNVLVLGTHAAQVTGGIVTIRLEKL